MSLLDKLTQFILGNQNDTVSLVNQFDEVLNNISDNILPLLKMHPTQQFTLKQADKYTRAILRQPNLKGNNGYKAILDVLTQLVNDKDAYSKNLAAIINLNNYTRSMEFAEFVTLVTALTSTTNILSKLVSLDVIGLADRPLTKAETVWQRELDDPNAPDMVAMTLNAFANGAANLNKTIMQSRFIKLAPNGPGVDMPKDGTQSNLIPGVGNLVVWFGKQFNTVSAMMYQRDKAYMDRLSLDIALLEEQKKAETDPDTIARIQKQIDYYTNLINKLETKIELQESALQ